MDNHVIVCVRSLQHFFNIHCLFSSSYYRSKSCMYYSLIQKHTVHNCCSIVLGDVQVRGDSSSSSSQTDSGDMNFSDSEDSNQMPPAFSCTTEQRNDDRSSVVNEVVTGHHQCSFLPPVEVTHSLK